MKTLPFIGEFQPDVVCSTQTWVLQNKAQLKLLLEKLMTSLCGTCWPRHADLDDEWSGTGVYRLQVRLNRPEGRPLYSLKWEDVA